MAGYFLYTIDNDAFTQLTTAPTADQGLLLADHVQECIADEEHSAFWPDDRDALARLITKRLAMPDWYSDLSYDDACVWDNVIHAFQSEPGQEIGIDFQCTDYESIYWDCTEIAAKKGAKMMAEPTFGSSGFRYFGKPTSEYSNFPMYSLFTPAQVRQLLAQLQAVEPHFRTLPNDEGSPHEQFFEGLLPAIQDAATNGRVLWVQTDT